MIKCPKCDYMIHEPVEECESTVVNSGSGYIPEFGQTAFWCDYELTCPDCSTKFGYSDSSL